MRRTLLLAAGLVVVLLAGVVGALALNRAEAPAAVTVDGPVPFSERPAPDERAPLPDRTLAGFAGGPPVPLAGYRGRPLVVNFWASWCGPCVEEIPAFQQVAAEVTDEVAFLGVDVADAPRRAEEFAADLGIDYDLALDPDRSLVAETGVFAMPTTLFVDRDGTIVHRVSAPLEAEELRAALREHLGVGTGDSQQAHS